MLYCRCQLMDSFSTLFQVTIDSENNVWLTDVAMHQVSMLKTFFLCH
jgi:hypothetical protein